MVVGDKEIFYNESLQKQWNRRSDIYTQQI